MTDGWLSPDGYKYGNVATGILICERCGSLVSFSWTKEHNQWHLDVNIGGTRS